MLQVNSSGRGWSRKSFSALGMALGSQQQVLIFHNTTDDHDLFGLNYKVTVVDITHKKMQLDLVIKKAEL